MRQLLESLMMEQDWSSDTMEIKELSSILQQNGVVGAGGAGFPTYAKLNENAENLARDMAVGQGENLNVLAELLEIKSQDKARFFAVSKANFKDIYASDNTLEVLASLQQVMAKDDVLKAYV